MRGTHRNAEPRPQRDRGLGLDRAPRGPAAGGSAGRCGQHQHRLHHARTCCRCTAAARRRTGSRRNAGSRSPARPSQRSGSNAPARRTSAGRDGPPTGGISTVRPRGIAVAADLGRSAACRPDHVGRRVEPHRLRDHHLGVAQPRQVGRRSAAAAQHVAQLGASRSATPGAARAGTTSTSAPAPSSRGRPGTASSPRRGAACRSCRWPSSASRASKSIESRSP